MLSIHTIWYIVKINGKILAKKWGMLSQQFSEKITPIYIVEQRNPETSRHKNRWTRRIDKKIIWLELSPLQGKLESHIPKVIVKTEMHYRGEKKNGKKVCNENIHNQLKNIAICACVDWRKFAIKHVRHCTA